MLFIVVLSSIDKEIEIIVIDNSNNTKFKNNIEEKYKNVKCISSSENIGMGAGNNLGIKNTLIKIMLLILNPDVILDNDTIDEIINASKKIRKFGIIAPISDNLNIQIINLIKNKKQKFEKLILLK